MNVTTSYITRLRSLLFLSTVPLCVGGCSVDKICYTPVDLSKPTPAREMKNERIPLLEVYTLSEKKLQLPQQFSKPITIALFGFDRSAEKHVMSWIAHTEKNFANHEHVGVCKVAMVGPVNYITRWVVETSIRSNVNPQHADSVYIYYGNLEPWKKLLNVQHKHECHVLLLDKEGVIHAHYRGEISDDIVEKIAILEKKLNIIK